MIKNLLLKNSDKEELFSCLDTIMTHPKNILRKVDVSNASELVMYAIRKGIIDTIEYNI